MGTHAKTGVALTQHTSSPGHLASHSFVVVLMMNEKSNNYHLWMNLRGNLMLKFIGGLAVLSKSAKTIKQKH